MKYNICISLLYSRGADDITLLVMILMPMFLETYSGRAERIGTMEMKLLTKKFIEKTTIESVKNIIGVDYPKMKDFFWDKFFSFEQTTCTILITRRCFLLAIWFLSCFLDECHKNMLPFELVEKNSCVCVHNLETDICNFILTDKGLPFLKKLQDVQSIVILDDICIHGRQIDEIKLSVNEISNIGLENIKKEVFLSSTESIVKPVDYQKIGSTNGRWLILSQRIVETINYLLLPYVSYINSFISYEVPISGNDKFLETIEADTRLKIFPFGEDDRQHLGKISFYIIEKENLKSVSTELKCIRYYYNFRTKIASFIPYVVLAPIKGQFKCDQLSKLLSKYLTSDAVSKILLELNELFPGDNDSNKGFIYNLLSCIASQHYGFQFKVKFTKTKDLVYLSEDFVWEEDVCKCLTMSFGEKIASIVLNFKNYCISDADENYNEDGTNDVSLINVQAQVDDFTIGRWEMRELAAIQRSLEPEKASLFQLYKNAAMDKCYKQQIKSQYSFLSKIAYSYLYSVINECDNGRQSISSLPDKAESFLEVGELGVLKVRDLVRDMKRKMSDASLAILLQIPYYYYILC